MKLVLTDRMKIIDLREQGVPLKKIAFKFGVSPSRISQITLYEKDKIIKAIAREKACEKLLEKS